ncbi:Dicarboxylate transport [Raoultella planticola]|uniref:Dicarboxylate transport n=1 Tax=Raoultella planticola TaxID=575 RepID=A0A485D676_RAOPL|nr:Dicarboxylate transport [Raoultella planticola]
MTRRYCVCSKFPAGELVSAINIKQFAMSGAFNGALPLWLNNDKWIIKDGWLGNPGPMTLRLDKDYGGCDGQRQYFRRCGD